MQYTIEKSKAMFKKKKKERRKKKKKKKKKKEIKKKKFTLLPDNFVVSADIVFKIRSFSKLLCKKQRK